jgi:hypothetical protein
MGKVNCDTNFRYSAAINLNNKAVELVNWAKTQAKGDKGKKTLSDASPAYESAIKELEEMRDHHRSHCPECKKGD